MTIGTFGTTDPAGSVTVPLREVVWPKTFAASNTKNVSSPNGLRMSYPLSHYRQIKGPAPVLPTSLLPAKTGKPIVTQDGYLTLDTIVPGASQCFAVTRNH